MRKLRKDIWARSLRASVIVAIIVLLISGIGCSGGKETADTAEAQEDQGPTTLRIWKFGGTEAETPYFEEQTKIFAAEHPELNVEYEYYYGQLRRDKIIAGYKANNLPDVFFGFTQDIPDFAGLRIIQPIDALDAERVDTWVEHLVPEIVELGRYNDKLYGLPMTADTAPFLAYNIDALEAAGFDRPPENWSELIEYAKALQGPDMVGIAIQASNAPVDVNIFEGIAYKNGGRLFDESKGLVTMDGPGFVDTLQLFVDLVEAGVTNKSAVEDNFISASQLFLNGKAAMWMSMSWVVTPWKPDGVSEFRVGSIPFPRPDKVTGTYSPASAVMDATNTLYVSSDSENIPGAMDYLEFWSDKERLSAFGRDIMVRLPASKESWDEPAFGEFWPEYVEKYKAGTLFEGAVTVPRFNGVTIVEPYLVNAIQSALLGKQSAEEALSSWAEKAQNEVKALY